MAILSKGCKPDKFESHTLPIFKEFLWVLLNLNLSLNQILLIFLHYMKQTFMAQLILAIYSFNLKGLSSFILKGFRYSYARKDFFCTGLISRKLCWFLIYVFNCLYFVHCLTSFCSIDHLFCLAQFLMLFHVI